MTLDATVPTRRRSDVTLIKAVRAGDPHAYAELFDRHRASVERLAHARRRDGSAAELVGSVFADGLRRILDGEADDVAVRPWLLTLTGVGDPESGGRAAFDALTPDQQTLLWQLIVDHDDSADVAVALGIGSSDVGGRLDEAREALRRTYLRQQREMSAPLHARTHLDDVTMHAEDCATCLGLWWAADELSTAKSLAETVLGGELAERYLRTRVHRRTRRVRSRWLPTTVATITAGLLLGSSIGALAVAHWGPAGVPDAWRAISAQPSSSSGSPESVEPSHSNDASGRPGEQPRRPDSGDDAGRDRPSDDDPSNPSSPPPDDDGSSTPMPVGFAFADPTQTTVDGETAFTVNFRLTGESARGSASRTATMRFQFDQPVRLDGASGDLRCTGGGTVITCTRSLKPGDTAAPWITVVGAERVSGEVRVTSGDLPDSPTSHNFSFGESRIELVPEPEPSPEPNEPGQGETGSMR